MLPKIILLALVFQACSTQKEINSNLEGQKDVLLGEWITSREESVVTEQSETLVLRRSSYEFPPSRFREHYTFLKNGTLTYTMPGADDRPETRHGRWKIKEVNGVYHLILEQETGGFSAEIVSLGEEKTVLKKQKQ